MQKTTGYAGGGKKSFSFKRCKFTKKLYCVKLMQAGNRTQVKNKGEGYVRNQNNDIYSLAQGKYSWGIRKTGGSSSKFVEASYE